jgi:Tfp pilus assembly protein PilO
MIKLKKKERAIAVAAAVIIGLFLLDRTVFFAMRKKLSSCRKMITLEESRYKKNLGLLKSKDGILADYNKYRSFLEVPFNDQRQTVAELLKEVERIAQESKVSVLNLSPQESVKQEKEFNRYSADLKMEANSEKLLNFLFKIQSSAFLLKIDRLSVQPKNEEASLLKVDVTVSIFTF